MPARDLLDEGLLLQKAGVLDRAMEQYSAALNAATEPKHRAEALRRQAHVHRLKCDWDQAIDAARLSAQVAEAAQLQDDVAEALNAEAAVHQSRGDLKLAVPLYERILSVTSHPRVRGVALQNLAAVQAMQGDLPGAERHFQQAYECFVEAGYDWGQAHILNNLGRLALDEGRSGDAEELLRRAIDAAKNVKDLDLLSVTRLNHAEALLQRGEYARAEEAASAAVGHFTSAGNHWRRIECLRILGDLHTAMSSFEMAERFFSLALRVAADIGAKVEHQQLRERLERLRSAD